MRFTVSASLALALTAAACAREAGTDTEAEAAAAAATAQTQTETAAAAPAWNLPDEAWRTVDQDRLMYVETDHGRVIIELAPEFAPNHVARMRELVGERFYDFLVFHRVIEGFMAQAGGSRANPGHATDKEPMAAEFTLRRIPTDLPMSELQDRLVNPGLSLMGQAGYWQGFPAGTQPSAQSFISMDGAVESWLLHCRGAAAMARTNDPNSARSQWYITTGNAEHLNATYTVWGRVRMGMDAVDQIAVGTAMEDPDFRPDVIRSIRIGSELPAEEQVAIQVADTDSEAFAAYLDSLRDEAGALPDICEIPVPTRIEE
ncbi:peptidylprolyl isomerase [Maricaulis parjimensis]|uniref:peptidylprolyl isomerase n=1 Tax=Maricaulis parjimensis TaxID=144023 RepID=UPI001EED418A|nr:peptidylprolyl isomerase [Maricaulis parjimensis]